ncbi:hypothetical protein TeGR_g10239, partial [Tetraparma gracilis]
FIVEAVPSAPGALTFYQKGYQNWPALCSRMGDRVQCVDVYDVGGEVLTAILANEDCEVETASLFLYLNGAFEDDPPQSAVQSEIEQLRR